MTSHESEEIRELLSSTGSELYTQIGLYLHDLEFTSDILDEEGDFADLFAEDDDCLRIGIPIDNQPFKSFIVSRSENIIKDYTTKNKSKLLLLKAQQLKNSLNLQNSDVYKKIGNLLFEYQVHCSDIQQVDDIKIFLNKSDLIQMGLKNAAKQKLAFRKVLRIINNVQKLPQPLEKVPNNIAQEDNDNKQSQAQSPKERIKSPKIIKKEPNEILKEMLQGGTVSTQSFWAHFFKHQKRVNYESLTNGIQTIMGIYNEINPSKNNAKRVSSAYIQAIILSVMSVEKESENEISFTSFHEYTNFFNSENIIETFETTQNSFELLLEADKTSNFKAIQINNFEDILFKIDIYGKLLSSNFEGNIWKYIISNKFISYLPVLMKLSFKFQKEYNNNCGVKMLESEMFNNYNRMASIIGNNKSSFYSLSESQLIYIIKLDCLAVSEEKLFLAVQRWAEKDIRSSSKKGRKSGYKSLQDRMSIFLSYVRFPLMSINFLLNKILPQKNKLFRDKDDFLYILIYKINLTLNSSKKQLTFDPNTLCCAYQPRIYQSDNKHNDDDMSLDVRLMRLSAENNILKQKNNELKEKNHKLKQKVQREKEKRKAGDPKLSLKDASNLNVGKKHRAETNAFTTIDHFAQVHAKKKAVNNKKFSSIADDSIADRQKHLKQVSRSVVNQVQDLQTGTSTIKFMVQFAESDSKESQDIFAQMRKKMTNRSKNVKSAHQRKIEKEKEEKEKKEQDKREMEETKKRLREQARKMKEEQGRKSKKKKPKKKRKNESSEDQTPPQQPQAQPLTPTQHYISSTMLINDEVSDDADDADDNEPQSEITQTQNYEKQRVSKKIYIPENYVEEDQPPEQEQDDDDDDDEVEEPEEAEEPEEVEMTNETDSKVAENEITIDIVDNDYGYPQIHDAYKQYYVDKNNTSCTNPTHLILFAKKNAIVGVTFASANKYFKARRNDPDALSMEDYMAAMEKDTGDNDEDDLSHLMSNPTNSTSPQPQPQSNPEDDDGNVSGHRSPSVQSGHDEIEDEAPPITITQSITDKNKTPVPDSDDGDHKQEMQMLPPNFVPKKRRRSMGKKKKKKLLIAAEMLGKLKKNTNYTRFETPLYILSLKIAEKKKVKDEKRLIRDFGLHLGYKVQLKQKKLKGVIKFIGGVHFTYGIIIGLEMMGNGNGKHAGDIDKIKYFDSKRNSGLFVRVVCIEKVLEKKKLKSTKKNKSMDRITGERFKQMLMQMEEEEEMDEEIDLSSLPKREKVRLERLHLEIGDAIEVDKGRKGILHFCGEVHWTDHLIFGVEFTDKTVGKNNGSYGDVEYFQCPQKRGMFFTSDKIRKKTVLNSILQW